MLLLLIKPVTSSFKLQMKAAKINFFDRKIAAAADRRKKGVLSRAGALVRGIARRSIRYRKNKNIHSPPGTPPYSHTGKGEFGIKTILFAYQPSTETVIVGPVGRTSRYSVPEALEFGGVSLARTNRHQRRKTGKKFQKVMIRKRPFMRPALQAFKDDYPRLWKDVVRG